ncbi:MAG: Na(+)-translocating NADH-quinone reductase subunit A [Bacteroidia bacterium]
MSKNIKITKGLDIKLKGEAEKVVVNANPSDVYTLKPADFHGLTPKLLLKEGAQVKAGTAIFVDKQRESVCFASPVSGEIVEVVRGEKRKILSVKILADKGEMKYESFASADPNKLTREQIKEQLLKSGCWPYIKQRPIDIVANPEQTPKAIFISAFDSSPLAPDYDFIVHNYGELFQTGVDALAKLTDGKVHLNVRSELKPSGVFTNCKNVQINKVSGPHPAGNVGVQIHHIDPINSGEVVWVVNPQDVLIIGRLFAQGKYDATKTIAVAGPRVKYPKYHRVISGATIKSILSDDSSKDNRYVSGNVLTGDNAGADGNLGFYHHQICVLEEGDKFKFFLGDGWMGLGLNKHSASRTYFSWLMPSKKYALDTNQNGEPRSFVMTGQYEKVFPFDIYPVHLLKSIITNDIESMEKLGIYEVAPEDFALCEYVCTSKINAQEIVREGLDVIYKECM